MPYIFNASLPVEALRTRLPRTIFAQFFQPFFSSSHSRARLSIAAAGKRYGVRQNSVPKVGGPNVISGQSPVQNRHASCRKRYLQGKGCQKQQGFHHLRANPQQGESHPMRITPLGIEKRSIVIRHHLGAAPKSSSKPTQKNNSTVV